MPNAETEILIQVENLPLCRAFYRDALMLGNPEIDRRRGVSHARTGCPANSPEPQVVLGTG